MPGTSIQVGPFLGGLNTFSDPTAVADNELVVCENFELDLDGSLKNRPPITDLGIDFPLDDTGNGNMHILGFFYGQNNASFIIASDGDSSTYYFTGSAWELITDTFSATAMLQFDGKAWLTAGVDTEANGGYWTPSGAFVEVPNMPNGEIIVEYKFRMFIAEGKDSTENGTRLYRSNVLGTPDLWEEIPDFTDIGAGDGQNIVQIVVYFNALLIFRTNSIYVFQFTSDPAAATLSLVVPNVGLNAKEAVDQFESYIYFMYEDKAYEFTNNRANQINVKVPFKATSQAGIYMPYAVSEFNRRIIFSYYNTTFVYSLRTRTWTTWKSTEFGSLGQFVKRESGDGAGISAYLNQSATVPTGTGRFAKTLTIVDDTTLATEDMVCKIRTKNFNYQASSIYKRLFWWGVDATFKSSITGLVYPISFNFAVSWQTLKNNGNWGDLLQFVWGQPQSEAAGIENTVSVAGTSVTRKFIKFLKSLRFRQIYFEVSFETDGSSTTAPVRLFSLMTYVNPKQTVGKEVT